jgi:hypothetical protein
VNQNINENQKYSSNAFKVNQIVQDFEKGLKEKEEAENKLLYIKSLNNSKKNIFDNNYGYNRIENLEKNDYLKECKKVNKGKNKDDKNFYNTFNKLSEC